MAQDEVLEVLNILDADLDAYLEEGLFNLVVNYMEAFLEVDTYQDACLVVDQLLVKVSFHSVVVNLVQVDD